MSRPDNNFLSFAHRRPLGLVILTTLVPPEGTHDTLKVTDCDHGHVSVERVIGGMEDCADVNNRCYRIIIGDHHTIWEAPGRHFFTIKGGSWDIEVRGILRGHAKEVDIDLGNWSDQSLERTERVFLNVRSEDGSPITWRRLNATTPRFRMGQKFKRKLSIPGELRHFVLQIARLLKHWF